MAVAFVVTGTDTGVGKTLVSTGLMERGRRQGLTVAGMKPIASGCRRSADGRRCDDAERLASVATVNLERRLLNPYAFEPPISPHLAAAAAGTAIDFALIERALETVLGRADLVVVEGVGGWLAPLSDSLTFADLARRLSLPVILVVGLRLGCLSHALLTAESLRAHGARLAGWVGSTLDPALPALDGNIGTLYGRLQAPCLGIVPWLPEPDPRRVADHLHLPPPP